MESAASELPHLAIYTTLPLHPCDSYDRLLIAQAMTEKVSIISADVTFDTRVWRGKFYGLEEFEPEFYELLISKISPATTASSAARTLGINGTRSGRRLLDATITTTATLACCKFC